MVPNAVVVHHDPHHRQVRFHRRGDDRRIRAEAAVADQRHGRAIRVRHLHAQHRRRTEAHRRQAARRDERAGHGDRKLLRHAVLVPADVGDQEPVLGQRAPQVAQDALGPHRELARTSTDGRSCAANSRRPAGDVVAQRSARAVLHVRAPPPPARQAPPSRRRPRRARSDSCGRSPRDRHRCGSAASAESRT